MYVNTRGQAAGSSDTFGTTTGVRQGCPLSPLLFSLFFDRVVAYIQARVNATDCLHVAGLLVTAALFADDVALLAPGPTCL